MRVYELREPPGPLAPLDLGAEDDINGMMHNVTVCDSNADALPQPASIPRSDLESFSDGASGITRNFSPSLVGDMDLCGSVRTPLSCGINGFSLQSPCAEYCIAHGFWSLQ